MALRWIEGFETLGSVGANITALLVRKYGLPLDLSAGSAVLTAGRFFGAAGWAAVRFGACTCTGSCDRASGRHK